jgi:hypothetical protein
MAIQIDGAKRKAKATKAMSMATAKEPKWDNATAMSGAAYSKHLHDAMYYYSIEAKTAQYKKWVINWVNASEQWSEHSKSIAKNSDSQFGSTLGGVCRMLTLGMPDVHEQYNEYWESLGGTTGKVKPVTNYINKELARLLTQATGIVDTVVSDSKPKVNVPTIQDRMNEIANKHILHFELFEDQLMNGETVSDPKAFEYLKTENCPQALIKKISAFFEVHRQELIEAKAGQDEQLKEGYSHYKASDYKRFEAFYAKLFADLEAYAQVKKATKQARVRKAPAKEKVVAKLKYLKEDSKSKLVSVNPVDILTAETLWVYNTKTRKLGKYVADAHAGTLGVKGTSIVGFDQSQSVQKTLRKPEQQLKDFKGAGKIQLRKFIESIKTTDTKLNGRINADTILLKVI